MGAGLETVLLEQPQYQAFVTGLPVGVGHVVEDPDSGESFEFAGRDQDGLIYAIATLYDGVLPDGQLLETTQINYLGIAGLQMKLAGGRPIVWYCQRPQDADALRALLEDYRGAFSTRYPDGRITVRAMPAHEAEPGSLGE